MKKTLLILLLTIPFVGFGQNDSIKNSQENNQLELEGNLKNGCISGDCNDGDGVFKTVKIYDGDSIEFTYIGQFKNGLFHGKGETKWTDGESHVGMYKNGQGDGYGIYIYNGRLGIDTYTGNFKDSNHHGYGIQTNINGCRYEGEWKNGRKHGIGEFTFKSGNTISGKWIEDEYVNE